MRRTYLDAIKELLKKNKEAREREERREACLTFVSHVGFSVLLLIAISLGFDICMRNDGDCRNHPENLLFRGTNGG